MCHEALHNSVMKVMCVASLALRLDKLRFCWKCYSMSWFTGGSKCTNPGCKFFGFADILPALSDPHLYCGVHDEIVQIMHDHNIADSMAAGQLVRVRNHVWPSLDHICQEAPAEVPAPPVRTTALAKTGAVAKATVAPKAKSVAKQKAMPKKSIHK